MYTEWIRRKMYTINALFILLNHLVNEEQYRKFCFKYIMGRYRCHVQIHQVSVGAMLPVLHEIRRTNLAQMLL